MKILKIRSWHTVDYPEKTVGSASIHKHRYRKNVYFMEMVDGYALYELEKSIIVTELRINNKTVMVDDPMHWIGMQKLAEACQGKVLIGGLGLGLILHHLKKNNAVITIDVVEANEDVIALVKPLLPDDPRVTIHLDNVFAYQWVHGDFDTIVLDLWVRTKKKMEIAGGTLPHTGILQTYIRFTANNPSTNVFVWGSRSPSMNPAVTPMSEEYLAFLKEAFGKK